MRFSTIYILYIPRHIPYFNFHYLFLFCGTIYTMVRFPWSNSLSQYIYTTAVCSLSYLNYQHIRMWVASLSREAGPFAVCFPSYINYQHTNMGVASLSREARPFVLRVILTINKSQIKMRVASLSREAGAFLVLALKAARGFPVYRKRWRQLPTTWYLCYQHVIPPSIPPERFYNFFSVSKVRVVLGLSSIWKKWFKIAIYVLSTTYYCRLIIKKGLVP